MKKYKNYLGLLLFLICSISTIAEIKNYTRLEESVITNTGFESDVRNTSKNISIITSEDIEAKGAKDISEVFKNVPGVQVTKSFGQININLRGQGDANTSNTLILIDGIKQNSIDSSGARISSLPVEVIERIEILPGGGSVLYGDGAVGGVINIITRSKLGRSIKNIYGEFGKNNQYRYGINYGDKITDKLFLQLNYDGNKSNGYRDNGNKDTEATSIFMKYSINKNDYVTFKIDRYIDDYGMPGPLSRKDLNNSRTQTLESHDRVNYKKNSYTFNYHKDISENLKFNLDTNYTKSNYNGYGSSEFFGFVSSDRTSYATSKRSFKPKLKFNYGNLFETLFENSSETSSQTLSDENNFKRSNLIVGLDIYDATSNNRYIYGNKINRSLNKNSNAVFLMNNLYVGDFLFNQGIRYERTKYDLDDNSLGMKNNYNEDTLYNYSYDFGASYFILKQEVFF